MSTGDIFNIKDESDIERLVGTINDPLATTGHVLTVQADKSVKAAPGGGGTAPVQAVYTGNAVSVDNGDHQDLTFDALESGTALLDLTLPPDPTFLTAGTYAVTVTVGGDALTLGGYAYLYIQTPSVPELVAAAYTAASQAGWSAAATFIAAEGDDLKVDLHNFDGAATRNFNILNACIVKLA